MPGDWRLQRRRHLDLAVGTHAADAGGFSVVYPVGITMLLGNGDGTFQNRASSFPRPVPGLSTS